ncbi:8115_t:CDS:1 [Scutellospora calospora]|uniref:8115_t:CDS:1 n=1 Tax=Scutellospora calospora TaxID=85575 RepID=A0ACA9L4G9_9GLOM|nr:8115_t:CDS:1 [Scutellospora calospora]
MLKIFIIILILIHVIASTSFNSLDTADLQTIGFKSESTNDQSYIDVDLDNDVNDETIDDSDINVAKLRYKDHWACVICTPKVTPGIFRFAFRCTRCFPLRRNGPKLAPV